MKLLTKFFNFFKKETWQKIKEEDANVTVWHCGYPAKILPAKLEFWESSKGNKKYLMNELVGINVGKPYEVDMETMRPVNE